MQGALILSFFYCCRVLIISVCFFGMSKSILHYIHLESNSFRIEYLDNWCKDLKILYLQSNLIPRIGI